MADEGGASESLQGLLTKATSLYSSITWFFQILALPALIDKLVYMQAPGQQTLPSPVWNQRQPDHSVHHGLLTNHVVQDRPSPPL